MVVSANKVLGLITSILGIALERKWFRASRARFAAKQTYASIGRKGHQSVGQLIRVQTNAASLKNRIRLGDLNRTKMQFYWIR